MGRIHHLAPIVAAATCCLLSATQVLGENEAGVRIKVDVRDVGLDGWVRPGGWTPLRVGLTNLEAGTLRVSCRWHFVDADGEQVVAQRSTTLGPGRQRYLWLYAALPFSTNLNARWRIEVIEAPAGRSLASDTVTVPRLMSPASRVVGVVGHGDMNIGAYDQRSTQHERCEVLKGLEGARLPDRWYGLSMLDALVWSTRFEAPDTPAMKLESRQALRKWVRRGGHLIVVLDDDADLWTQSTLADLLPDVDRPVLMQPRSAPSWLGEPKLESLIRMYRLTPRSRTVTLLRDRARGGEPVVVAGGHGFGRVTLVGVNLTDPELVALGLPDPARPYPETLTLWRSVFQWRSPVYSRQYVKDAVRLEKMSDPDMRRVVDLGTAVIRPRVRMASTAAPALMLAIALFIAYWVVAGPAGYTYLRRTGRGQHAWLLFVIVVLAFCVVSWGGALLLRPQHDRIEHVTVVDVLAPPASLAAPTLLRVRSWAALLVARHGAAHVALDGAGATDPSAVNTLAAVGAGVRGSSGDFASVHRYRVACAAPAEMDLPFRSTAKLLELDFMAATDEVENLMPWGGLQAEMIDGAKGSVRLSHSLPEALLDPRVVFCPQDGQEPVTWRLRRSWPPGVALTLDLTQARSLLVEDPKDRHYIKRKLGNEGHLGHLMSLPVAGGGGMSTPDGSSGVISRASLVPAIDMLSFFSLLPPPDFRDASYSVTGNVINYQRTMGRNLDLTPVLGKRRLIIIGHIEGSSIPVPLTVDGRRLPQKGWTVFRWICPLED
jgi:hypothetical protein